MSWPTLFVRDASSSMASNRRVRHKLEREYIIGACRRSASVDGPNESTHFNFPPPDLTNTPENSTHIYFKDIILPASDEVRAPVPCWPQAASRASAEGHGHAQQRGGPPGGGLPPAIWPGTASSVLFNPSF